jgi:predicted transposase YbfD/YdcC
MNNELMSHFAIIEDPRINRQKKYTLSEILFVILTGALCGITNYVDMEDFGKAHKEWYQKYFEYKNGIPSHDTLGRVMRLISPESFQDCFAKWTKSLHKKIDDIVAIDGKNLRHSFDNAAMKASIYMVSAWSCNSGLALAQEKVQDKSNEITAIPKLLDLLDISGCLVTIDAMGTQYEIADQIVLKGGNYLLSLKGNQGNLHKDVKLFFEDSVLMKEVKQDVYEDLSVDHGRIETRKCSVVTEVKWLKDRHEKFNSISSIIKIESLREFKNGSSPESEIRYYISSATMSAERVLNASRSHWQIENNLHWILDMNFDEDQSRVRKDHAPENMSIARRIALNMINNFKKEDNLKISFRRIQNKLAWDQNQLNLILQQKF